MSITTKRGDGGFTFLPGGRKVPKDDAVIEALGTLDELCAVLGTARVSARPGGKKEIKAVQRNLFVICAEIARDPRKKWPAAESIGPADILRLENLIAGLEKKNPPRPCFCLAGVNARSAAFDVARTVARRAERRLVTLLRKRKPADCHVLIYLNRLSDLLFLWARIHEK